MFKIMDGSFRIKFLTSIATILWAFTLTRADNVLQGGSLLYVLSEDQLDSVAAKNQCAAMGGRLAHFEEPSSSDIKSKLNALYHTNELTSVKVYTYTVNYKYVSGMFDGYGSPDTSFPNFKLYGNSRPEYNTTFVFCKASYNSVTRLFQKWSVQTTSCINGWTHDFTLYGGEKDRGTKPVYRYHNSGYSVRLSLSDEPSTTELFSTVNYDTRLSPLYIPDLRVQTGIQSDINQTDWLWDNHVVNSFPFDLPPANKDKCQQLSLRYNDVDWVASAVECGSTTAYYYMCQIKFSIQAEAIMCNSTSVLVSWNLTLYKDLFSGDADVTLNIHVGPFLHLINGTLGTFLVPNLKPRTTYRIFAEFWHSCLTKYLRSDDVYVTTSYGKPEAVTTAYVANNTASDDCVIEWSRDNSDGNITSYEIVANNLFNSSIKLNVTSWLFENGSTRYTIPSELLTIYGYNRNISFKIFANNCLGTSNALDITGFCVSKSNPIPILTTPSTQLQTTYISIAIVLPTFLLLFLVGVLIYKTKYWSQCPRKNEEKTPPGNVALHQVENVREDEVCHIPVTIDHIYEKPFQNKSQAIYENVSATNHAFDSENAYDVVVCGGSV